MNKVRRVLIFCLVCLTSPLSYAAPSQTAKFSSGDRQVTYEIFGAETTGPILIMLHGASGPGVPFYREQAEYFAEHGYMVLLLHYFDATGSFRPSDKNYATWEKAVSGLIDECHKNPSWSNRKIALLGFSLGASVALAAGSQALPLGAVAEWYGSLPDAFFMQRKGMPPLLILHGMNDPVIPFINGKQLAQLCEVEHYTCESHFYSDQGHGFTGDTLQDADRRTLDFFSRRLH